ncbi:MAG: hypothetical protein RLZZ196_1482 [Bacteroidota bacterium]|jgi:hypothetical protein
MAILSISTDVTGQAGLIPQEIYIKTDDTLDEVTAAGYLNQARQQGFTFSNTQIAHVYGSDFNNGSPGCLDFQVSVPSNPLTGNFSLVNMSSSGEVELPVSINHIAVFKNTDGVIGDGAETAINPGNIQAGLPGTAGSLICFPARAARGSLKISAFSNPNNTITTIRNLPMEQAATISIPDPGASTANFLLNTGPENILNEQQVVSLMDILLASGGTWTMTRVAQGNYALVHTAAADTSTIGWDITPIIRTASSKGFRLDSFDLVYSIATDTLNAHTVTLDRASYANNVAVSITSVGLTGSLSTATQANPYLTNIAVSSPAFLNTDDSKYILELTVNANATTAYSLYGLILRFSQTIA